MQKAIFGAGCFWGVELTFSKVEGVESTAVGYCGGSVTDPTYEIVCTGQSGHAEVVLVEFNPDQVSFDKLLDTFWSLHDPTTLNRQGPDIGTQYRSVIFFQDEDQAALSKASKNKLQASVNMKMILLLRLFLQNTFIEQKNIIRNIWRLVG